ncbi:MULTISPECIES: hypothetical protein [unclassified Crossiella]|uniref:hypothetical protein n=1 Tax=unclassified Crossiella TaxID=2620835 RepID=UPI001FFF9EBA|nr:MULTISPECIES: hypothetical protein [unclassified Crossiella]MCK2242134.1 hypothetical protein [Crossiella sp. S99.2]MCK2256037.1 hypothetical protein [Crossiella sp. S99.1]
MTYEVLVADVAKATLATAPAAAKAAFERKRRQLLTDPHDAGRYVEKEDRYYGDMGEHGIVCYTIHDSVVRVVIWRVQFS